MYFIAIEIKVMIIITIVCLAYIDHNHLFLEADRHFKASLFLPPTLEKCTVLLTYNFKNTEYTIIRLFRLQNN